MNHLELQEFFVEGRDQKTSHVLLHITEPSTAEEYAKGYFFALIEINNGTIGHIEKFQKIIDDIESGYYETEHEEGQEAFDITLEFINRRSEQVLTDSADIHALVGVIKDNTLSFSYHGSPHALLFYRQKQDFASMPIIDINTPETGKDIFPAVLQGKLNAGDFLFVSTPHVRDYFTDDRLEKLITSRSVKQSSDHIHKVLRGINNPHSFGGIIFRILPQSEKPLVILPSKTKQTKGSEASLNKLISSKQSTADTLSPPVFRNILREVSDRLHKKKRPSSRSSTEKTTPAPTPSILEKEEKNDLPSVHADETIGNAVLIEFGRAIVNIIIGTGKTLLFIVLGITKILLGLFILITNKNNSRKEVLHSLKRTFQNTISKFETLPFISKFLFILTVVAFVIFAVSISTVRIRHHYAEKQEAYKNLLSAVQNKKDAAEASIIYDDTTTALTLLQEAKGLLSQLPEEDKKAQEQKLQFEKSIEESLRKVQKMKTVTLDTVATLPETTKTTQLVRIDDTLLAFGVEEQILYRINTKTKQVVEGRHDGIDGLRTATTPKEQDTTVFIHADNRLALYQKDAAILSPKDIGYPGTNPSIVDAFVYNVKLYTLDRGGNQIYKHNKTQTGYDKGTPWVKTTTDLSKAVSLAIDGDMFILAEDGNIMKFTRGEQQAFTVTGLEPELDKPTKIWTYNEVDRIYIIEPTHKRFVILDKNGKLVEQFTASEWVNPTSMVVDEAAKTVYILDRNKIYSFSL